MFRCFNCAILTRSSMFLENDVLMSLSMEEGVKEVAEVEILFAAGIMARPSASALGGDSSSLREIRYEILFACFFLAQILLSIS